MLSKSNDSVECFSFLVLTSSQKHADPPLDLDFGAPAEVSVTNEKTGKSMTFTMQLAVSPEEHAHGLMYRKDRLAGLDLNNMTLCERCQRAVKSNQLIEVACSAVLYFMKFP